MNFREVCGGFEKPRRQSGLWRALMVALCAVLVSGLLTQGALAAPLFAALTIDARTGKVLYSQDADGIRHPASLTKMMTLYILFEELSAGRLSLSSNLTVSARATGMAPSKLGAKAGEKITVETAIQALVVKSANDVAATVAENIEGSEKAFAQRMTRTARSIGMSRTTFVNASGLPNPAQVTTARDMATLGLRLMRDFPRYYPYFRTRSFVYEGRTINGHNRLLGNFEGTDGIKTGFINASGFNLVTSVRRGDKRLVGVVLGGRSGAARDAYMRQMLSRYFDAGTNGKTIAAYAGSSKGALDVDETQTASAAPAPAAPKQETRKEAASKVLNKRPGKADQDQLAAASHQASQEPAEQGDTEDDANIGTLSAQVSATDAQDAPSEPAEKVETVPQPQSTEAAATVPFKVKTPSEQMADQAQVASLAAPAAADAGWTINLGDYATKKDAMAVLQTLRKRTPDVLSGKTAQTVTVEKKGKVTYRARFTGFDEAAASTACKAVKKHKTPCEAQGPT